MNLTLHLTNRCNLACTYCFVAFGELRMTADTAKRAVDLAVTKGSPTGILFYGGEPLLEREVIHQTVAYAEQIREKTGHQFFYKVTTNGVLLDEDFLQFAQSVNLNIGFSHDGPAQDDCRFFSDGSPSSGVLADKIPLLLRYQPYAIGMSVLDASVVHKAADMVKFLRRNGFRYMTLNLNYDAPWTQADFDVLGREYEKLARLYLNWTLDEQKFYLSPFDQKILSHVKGGDYNIDRRKMSQNQPSVAPDGTIFPGSRYVDDPAFAIGDVWAGIDEGKQAFFTQKGAVPLDVCKACAIQSRCNYAYDMLARQGEAFAIDIKPVQCAHERLLTPIADQLAEELYSRDSALFMHKHYNEMFPFLSALEEGILSG